MKLLTILVIFPFIFASNLANAQWPMSNDTSFDSSVANPMYLQGQGPKILLDNSHHNFFIQWDFIEPFENLAKADGYQPVIDNKLFTEDYLAQFDIVMIVTALPFDFTTKTEVTTESTFTEHEINALYQWVFNGGSLLVFSEHAPFDQAINPLLAKFGIVSSVGTVIDTVHYDKSSNRKGWIVYSQENGLLDTQHPIISGRNSSETVNRLVTFGGSALSGENYTNILKLSENARNIRHSTGVGPIGMGESQGLAGFLGSGKVVAFGDSNGFTAMSVNREDGSTQSLGMNTPEYDWKKLVLNTLHWLSKEQTTEQITH